MTKNNYKTSLNMVGTGNVIFNVPSGYGFMSVINATDNTVWLYAESTASPNKAYALLKVYPFTQRTIPISQTQNNFTFQWLNGGGVDAKKVDILLSEQNLGFNGDIGGSSLSSNVTVSVDAVGIARQDQFPLTLVSGRLGVDVVGVVEVSNDVGNPLPVNGTVEVTNDVGNPLPVNGTVGILPLSNVYNATQALTTTAVQLPTRAGSEFLIQADPTNTTNVVIGNVGGQNLVLTPGSGIILPISNLNLIYAKMVSLTGNISILGVY